MITFVKIWYYNLIFIYFSGSEDSCGYLWDRHYGVCLAKYEHSMGVVNAVAFSPTDQEYAVTIGDDHTIRVWRSRNKMQHIPPTQALDGDSDISPHHKKLFDNT